MSDFLYGRNPVMECLRAGRRRLRRLLLAEGIGPRRQIDELRKEARSRGCAVEVRPREDLSRLAESGHHQGVVLEAGPYPYAALEEILESAERAGLARALLLLLDRIQDPQNVGTLLRTAEAVGVQGILLPKHRAAAITPAVVKSSAGATEHLPIAIVTNLATTIEQLKEAGLWVYGLEGSPEADRYTAIDWDRPLALAVGSEGSGLRRLVRERCDGLARLPMRGRIESLNASVAGSVMLYHIWESRSQVSGSRE